MKFLYKIPLTLILNGLSLFALTYVLKEITYTGGILFFVVGAFVMAVLNGIFKPIIKILSLPLIFLTGGFFLIVINGFLLWFLSYFLHVAAFRDVSLTFPNFGTYVIGGLVLGLVNLAESLIF